MAIEVPERRGEVDVKSACLHGLDSFAVKIASGFFDNALRGLSTGSGLMVLISATTGFPLAILLDNGYLTDVRTGHAGAVAAKHLARERLETAGVIGTGRQARFQIEALRLVRDFRRLLVWGRNGAAADRYAAEMSARLGSPVERVANVEAVLRESDIVVTTTPSREPLVRAAWLHPGLHLTAMGSDFEGKQELEPEALARADLLVCDLRAQCARCGELRHALAAGLIPPDREIVELGDLTASRRQGRTSDDQITICDLTGVGVQDTAVARLAYARAVARGLGRRFV